MEGHDADSEAETVPDLDDDLDVSVHGLENDMFADDETAEAIEEAPHIDCTSNIVPEEKIKGMYPEPNVVEQRPYMKTTADDPSFISNYHSHSRLHHLSTWGYKGPMK